ncbi:acyl-CoA dehydrogenase family protein [Streptomyces zaomyceticus]|uniref:Acyl-CoA dehydrogenase n=1 Tax=Streptomyces zaomyceticus TaxID=68286 RepID=A0ABZ1LKT1_9ACTN|nr:acyl-CoA dehydrogenase [Streptomyces zaomyceticus]WSQ23420.1 acyl-CoA dehydrogenase [Streptomyces zaomyceticus]
MTTADIDIDAGTVLKAVRESVRILRENGRTTEERGWLAQENLELLDQAGVFRAAVPHRFGGLDLPLADQFALVAEIARGCGSTGWVANAWISSAWIISQYPDLAQEEIHAGSAGSLKVSGGFTPTGRATRTDDGFVLNGSWRFNTGIRGADWNILAALVERSDDVHEEVYAVVRADEMTLADDWDVSAAAGTGSCTSSVKDLFVPAHRVVDGFEVLEGQVAGRAHTEGSGREYGLTAYVMALSAAAYLGMARAGLELFLDRLPGKGIAYTHWEEQRAHPYVQFQVAAAANKISAAQALADSWTGRMQAAADAGERMSMNDRVEIRSQITYAVLLAKEAVDTLHSISGASVIQRSQPFQRVHRDIQGLALHGLMAPLGGFEAYGRVLVGLDPDTEFF